MSERGLVSSSALAVLLCCLAGCARHDAAAPEQSGGTAEMADTAASADEIAKAIAQLPEAERPVATAQQACPVSGEPLGSMGMPYKVNVKDRDVYLCCEGCEKRIKADPDKYLARLPAK
ncbi:MAG: hypothetical protein K1X74_17920 [Pirellulales bacterium]|nr:hypothetical protein [Pirellulales bacterium]